MLTGRSSLCDATTIQIQQMPSSTTAPVATSSWRGETAIARIESRLVRPTYAAISSSPMLIVSTNAPSFFRPPISSPEPGTRALTRVRPMAFEVVRARCERCRDRVARGAALRPAARVLRDMAPFPDRRRGDLRRPHAAAHGTSDAHAARLVDVMVTTPVDARQSTGAGAYSRNVPSRPPSVATYPLCRRAGGPDSVGRRRVPFGGWSEEASPSPVDGARLLSGLRVIPSRGFKSRRLRSWELPVRRKRGPRELRVFLGVQPPDPARRGFAPRTPMARAGVAGIAPTRISSSTWGSTVLLRQCGRLSGGSLALGRRSGGRCPGSGTPRRLRGVLGRGSRWDPG